MQKLIDDLKKTVVFLGKITDEKKVHFFATGFLVSIKNIYHLITAKHVIVDVKTNKIEDNGVYIYFNSKVGEIAQRSLEETKKKFGVDWIFHKNHQVDIAVIPFGLDPQKDDVKVIPENQFLSPERLFELYDVFFLSYQPGVKSQKRIVPVIRNGMVSLINNDKTFYIDGFVFPGNSGSPVFLKHSPIRFDEKGISIGGDSLGGKFTGVIGEYLTYQEVAISAQTGRTRVVFEENTGLSKVWSVSFISEIIESRLFKKQLNKIIGGNVKGET